MRVALVLSVLTSLCLQPSLQFDPETDIFFQLYTRSSPQNFQTINIRDQGDSLVSSHFDPQHPTRVIIHDWRDNGQSEVNTKIRDAYHQKGEFNVIVVDWSVKSSPDPLDGNSKYNTPPDVGDETAEMIQYLERVANISPLDVTLIGHGVGAHIAGIAGKSLDQLRVIVALDPSGMAVVGEKSRLSTTDADYVQWIKTSVIGSHPESAQGNFYPNGGVTQPGCLLDISCNHNMSYIYFARSINEDFEGRRCRLVLGACMTSKKRHSKYMGGEPVDTTAEGNFYVEIDN